jgi:hypothetical protein
MFTAYNYIHIFDNNDKIFSKQFNEFMKKKMRYSRKPYFIYNNKLNVQEIIDKYDKLYSELYINNLPTLSALKLKSNYIRLGNVWISQTKKGEGILNENNTNKRALEIIKKRYEEYNNCINSEPNSNYKKYYQKLYKANKNLLNLYQSNSHKLTCKFCSNNNSKWANNNINTYDECSNNDLILLNYSLGLKPQIVLGFDHNIKPYYNCSNFLVLHARWRKKPCSELIDWSYRLNVLFDYCIYKRGQLNLFPARLILPEDNTNFYFYFKYGKPITKKYNGTNSNIMNYLNFIGIYVFPFNHNNKINYLLLFFFKDKRNDEIIITDIHGYQINKYNQYILFRPQSITYDEVNILTKWFHMKLYLALLDDDGNNIEEQRIFLFSRQDIDDYRIRQLIDEGKIRKIDRIRKEFKLYSPHKFYDAQVKAVPPQLQNISDIPPEEYERLKLKISNGRYVPPHKLRKMIIEEYQKELNNRAVNTKQYNRFPISNNGLPILNNGIFSSAGGGKVYDVAINNKKYKVSAPNSRKAASWVYRKKFGNKYNLIYVNGEVFKGICYKNGRKMVKKVDF